MVDHARAHSPLFSELYRDLLWPGGVSNFIPGAGVLALIGAPAVVQGFDRLARDPASGGEVLAGMVGTGLNGILHSTLDRWWRRYCVYLAYLFHLGTYMALTIAFFPHLVTMLSFLQLERLAALVDRRRPVAAEPVPSEATGG